jgi:hypothetical protein
MVKTLANIKENPVMVLCFWNPEKIVVSRSKAYDDKDQRFRLRKIRKHIKEKGTHYPVKGLLVFSITEIFECRKKIE